MSEGWLRKLEERLTGTRKHENSSAGYFIYVFRRKIDSIGSAPQAAQSYIARASRCSGRGFIKG
jgi:hypothetical protein